eukprot:TRINITY_DN613_c3_g1_i1.p1 TRINITY_DN613_c3_g1~~TRINITY_DN613_c3_g1_i1.p1  ORF type:complete len:379 (+),score=41.83 TRINITY_DN613_c3_g1_i1:72-1139(+)
MEAEGHFLDDESSHPDDEFDNLDMQPVDFDEDTYAMTLVQFTRDAKELASKSLPRGVVISRFGITSFLIVITVVLQLFLLHNVRRFVSARAVHDIRLAYHHFEVHMYTNLTLYEENADPSASENEEVPELNFRGKQNDWNWNRFATLSEDIKSNVCRIPLSEPFFCWVILFLWTTTCVQEVRRAKRLFQGLVLNTKTCSSMTCAYDGALSADEDVVVIQQLTRSMKVSFTLILALRVGVTCYLLWEGCRWLLATTSFADIILNAIALEFILYIKDTLYLALMPNRFRGELERCKHMPVYMSLGADYWQLVSVACWFTLASGWVTAYMYFFQRVLPGYQFDVHDVCADWIKVRFEV